MSQCTRIGSHLRIRYVNAHNYASIHAHLRVCMRTCAYVLQPIALATCMIHTCTNIRVLCYPIATAIQFALHSHQCMSQPRWTTRLPLSGAAAPPPPCRRTSEMCQRGLSPRTDAWGERLRINPSLTPPASTITITYTTRINPFARTCHAVPFHVTPVSRPTHH